MCGAFAFVYLYAFPFYPGLRSANELPRVLLTMQMVDRGTFRLNERLGELGSTFDVTKATPNGGRYSNKAPGASFLAVPGYLALKGWHAVAGGKPTIGEATWVFRVTAVTVPALLFLPWFLVLARRFAPAEPPGRAALLGYALGSMALPYGLLFFSHQLAAVCAAGAFVAAAALVRGEARRPDGSAVAAGALAGLAVLVDYQSVIAAAAVGGYLLWGAPRRLRQVALAAAAAVPSAVALLLYHRACFGSPWKTGYSFAQDVAHEQGVLGIIGPNRAAAWQALLAPDNGLVVLAPWLLLAVVGAVAIARDRQARARAGAETVVAGVVVVGYLLFVASLEPEFGRAGWSVGPRYIVAALPFAAWVAVAGFAAAERWVATRVLAQALVLVGVVVHVAAASTYPHWPISFDHPLYEVSFRALREGLAPPSLGTAVGLHGAASLVPLYLAAGALAVALLWGADRWRLVAGGVAAALAAGIVWGYAWLPRTKDVRCRWEYVRCTMQKESYAACQRRARECPRAPAPR